MENANYDDYLDNIYNNLVNLYNNNNVPNIIFHGNILSGKKTILEKFLNTIYYTKELYNKYVLLINCSHGKGNIKFIRENLKYFSNSIISKNNLFKSVILINADKLTTDAQTALRRCIEIYNHSSRFFIVIENKDKLLKPIISRFSDIYFLNNLNNNSNLSNNNSNLSNNNSNLNNSNLNNSNKFINIKCKKITAIKNILSDYKDPCLTDTITLSEYFYNNGYSANMFIEYINSHKMYNDLNSKLFLSTLEIYKKELRNEELLIIFCLNYIFFRNIIDLKNISTI